MRRHCYHTYILSNAGRTVLYVGVTNDLARRLDEHRRGAPGSFTTTYRATDLPLFEPFGSTDEAVAREKPLKRWNRAWKWTLVRQITPGLRDLTSELIHLW